MKKMNALFTPKKALANRTEQAVMELLPVDEKTLRRAARLLEPKNLKRLGLAAAGGSVLFSALGTAGRDRIYRAAVARELKKQLEPVNKKLDALEQQNEELRRQNEELQRQLAKA